MPPSKAKQALIAQRRSEMLLMKVQGRTASQIADHFGISPATARSDLSRAIKKARDLEVQDAELYRYIQGARLEELLRAVWPAATGSAPDSTEVDLKASEHARKLIVDITDLFGLKVPVRTEISGPDGGALQLGPTTTAELEVLMGLGTPVSVRVDEDDDAEDDQEDVGDE
jgi:hypothetical protein